MARSPRPKPLIDETRKFVEYHLGKGCFAPHTGQDWPAWCAFVYLVQCWCHGGGDAAVDAMKATVACAQPTTEILRTFVQAIPAIGDWSHVRELWPRVAPSLVSWAHDEKPFNIRELAALERCGVYSAEHTIVDWKIYQHGFRS